MRCPITLEVSSPGTQVGIPSRDEATGGPLEHVSCGLCVEAQVVIIVAGCLGMAYTQLTTSAVVIQFARSLGATGLHIGILGAIPTGMLFMQFVAAYCANRVRYRRPLWAAACYAQRVCYLPIALGAWLYPECLADGLALVVPGGDGRGAGAAALLDSALDVVDGRLPPA